MSKVKDIRGRVVKSGDTYVTTVANGPHASSVVLEVRTVDEVKVEGTAGVPYIKSVETKQWKASYPYSIAILDKS
jgi:hypothetical protein